MKKTILLLAGMILLLSTNQGFADSLVGSDKDEHGCIGSAGYTWSASQNKCIRSWEENVGSDKDEHGCIGSAGYTWSTSQNKCIRPWEENVYSNSEDFLKDHGATCKVATDGCNTIQITNGELGGATRKYCEDIYGEGQTKKWSCLDKSIADNTVSIFSASDKNLYNKVRTNLGLKTTAAVVEIINDFGDKVLRSTNYKIPASLEILKKTINNFDKAIDRIVSSYPADMGMSERDTQKYYILHLAKFELQIMQNRWEK